MKTYNIGDKVWFAFVGHEQITEKCPVCFGKLAVILILGNEDQVTIPCDYCGRGYEEPRGTVQEWQYRAEARQVEITDIDSKLTGSGEIREYSHKDHEHYYRLDADRIFDTEQEANTRATELAEQQIQTEAGTRRARKEYNHRNYAWHAGYHMREAKEATRKIEYHTARAVVCKARAKAQ